ncbi:MAG: YkgJ family cysteine cluster protein [Pseudomonadota bacterium]
MKKEEMRNALLYLKQIRHYSLTGLLCNLYLRLRGKTILVTGSCRGCGSCCLSLSLEGWDGWLRSEKAFHEIVANFPEYTRFVISGRDPQGFLLFSCSWRTEQGTCANYEKRLTLCRNFPENSLFFAGGRLPPTCGYKFTTGVPFQKMLDAAVQKQK